MKPRTLTIGAGALVSALLGVSYVMQTNTTPAWEPPIFVDGFETSP